MLPSSLSNLDPTKVLGSAKPLTNDDLPGLLPRKQAANNTDAYTVRYQKFNMSAPADILELERLETKALQNRGVFVMSRHNYVFMDQFFFILGYIETENNPARSSE